MPRLSDDQKAERARGIGASDVASIAGVNPYRTAFEVYLEKIGELDPDARIDDASRDRMERGHRLEDVALEWDRDITGEPFERVTRTVWHPRLPFLFCHPDARRRPWSKTRRLIEVKTSARPWKDGVPRHVEVQVQTQMAVTGAASVDIVVLGFDGPPARFLVERDDELIAALEGLAFAFWARVERRDPPPMDGSDGARAWLDRTRWKDEPELVADPEQRKLLDTFLRVRAARDHAEAEMERLANVIKFSMAGAGRLSARGLAKIIWTAPAEVKTVRWKDVAARLIELYEPEELDALLLEYTSVREARTFRVTDEREGIDK
jgi:putative phage-type endonuclease